jgi:DNA polymerase I-like protein with 3'-5' exonuclease and polymerase domains
MIQKPLFAPQVEWTPPEEFPNLSKYDEIAIDFETKDPDLKTKGSASVRGIGDVVGIAVAVKDFCGYYPIAHETGPNMNRKQVLGWFADVLKTPADKIFHNAMYDILWIKRLGLTVHGTVVDTMTVASLVNENRFRYDLNSVGAEYTGMTKNESALNAAAKEWGLDPKAEMYKLPAMYVGEYAEKDAELTLALWQELKKEIEHQELHSIVSLEQRVFPCLVDMKWKGVRVDLNQLEILEKKLKTTYSDCVERVKKATGIFPEIWAAKSIAKVCDGLGIKYERTEKTNAPSFTKNYLSKHKNPVIRSIAAARQADKLRNTFLESIKNYVVNGRIHADIHQLKGDQGGTVTGRLSYSHPNLQQLPNYTNIGMGIRSIFIPEEGCEWGCFDYSQQEPRLVVHFALRTPGITGVSEIAEKYHKGVEKTLHKNLKIRKDQDFHQIVADIADIDRSDAKTINLGLFYGMGQAKLQAQLGINDENEAKELLARYHRSVPFVKQLIRSVMDRAQRKGRVRTLLGRACRFDMWEPKQFGMHKPLPFNQACDEIGIGNIKRAFTYKALNKLIQGSAADMTKQAMINLYEQGITPMIQLHDELDISVKSESQAKEIVKIMEESVPLEIPNKVDYESGSNWGSIDKENEVNENFF